MKIIKLTEQDLVKIVKKVLKEDAESLPEFANVPLGKVELIQQALIDKGYDIGLTGIDGKFGANTKSAVIKFQTANNLKPDGIVGINTAKALGVSPINSTPKSDNSQPKVTKNKSDNTYLLFDGNTLSFIENGKVIKTWKAYSGRTKWNIFGDKTAQKYVDTVGQDPQQFMKIGNAGPIPMGNYSISQIQKRTKGDADALCTGKNYKQLLDLMMKSTSHDWNTGTTGDLIAWGNFRCPITPMKGTNTYGRGSFYIHGGGIAGSIGCIDLLLNMTDFAKTIQEWKNRTGNNSLKLTVKY
jgi:hypothetical protein